MVSATTKSNQRTTAKRVICLIVAVLAVLAAARVLLEADFVLQYDYRFGLESTRHIVLYEGILLILAGVLLFEAYRLVKYFIEKPVTHDS